MIVSLVLFLVWMAFNVALLIALVLFIGWLLRGAPRG
jgi:hypothetical protein